MSKSWCTFSTRITPACLSIAANTSGRALVRRTRWPGGHAEGGDAGLHDDDRLDQRQVARDAGELARVAHRLQVEADRAGGVVVDPVLHEVVAGDVDPVAGRPEGRDAQVAAGGRREHRDAERPGLGEQAELPVRRQGRGERGVEPHGRVVVDQPEGVRARRRACRRCGPGAAARPAAAPRRGPPRRSPRTRRAGP